MSTAPRAPRRLALAAEASGEIITRPTLVYRLCRWSSFLACKLGLRLRREGLKNLPAEGGLVLASNHQSYLDILIIGGATPRHVAFLARDTLARWRWLAFVMRQCGAVLVRRGRGDRAALSELIAHLVAGDCAAVFAEGTRSPDGRLQPFRSGAFRIAQSAGVPVVPVGIRGSFQAWPRQARLPRPHKVSVHYGEPIPSDLPDLSQRVRDAVLLLSGQRDGEAGEP